MEVSVLPNMLKNNDSFPMYLTKIIQMQGGESL